MASGEYRDQIHILTQVSGQDEIGQPRAQWVESAPVWADVRMVGGREQLRAGKEIAAGQYTIKLRYRAGLTAAQRVRLVRDGVVVNIKLVQPDTKRSSLILFCEIDQ